MSEALAFCAFFHVYPHMSRLQKFLICCAGQPEQKNAQKRRMEWAWFYFEWAKGIEVSHTAFKGIIRKFLKMLVVHRVGIIYPLIPYAIRY
jgi:hypothetical protein